MRTYSHVAPFPCYACVCGSLMRRIFCVCVYSGAPTDDAGTETGRECGDGQDNDGDGSFDWCVSTVVALSPALLRN